MVIFCRILCKESILAAGRLVEKSDALRYGMRLLKIGLIRLSVAQIVRLRQKDILVRVEFNEAVVDPAGGIQL